MNPLLLRALDVELELDPGRDAGLAAGLLSGLPSSWPRSATPRPAHPRLTLALAAGGGRQALYADGRLLAAATAGAERGKWLARLVHEVVMAVARRSRFLWLHAGAVAWRGRALVLPGSPFAGKSTLVAALLERGALYLSDEWVAVDDAGQVHPLPRPLRLREGRARPARRATAALPLAATALLSYRTRPAPPPARLGPAAALAALAGHSLGAEGLGEKLAAAAALLRRPVFAGFRGEAGAAAADWLRRLEEERADAA